MKIAKYLNGVSALVVSLFLLMFACRPGAQELEWLRQFDSVDGASEFAFGIDGEQDIYVGGGTYGTLPGQTSVGIADGYLRKYDSDGNEIWTRQFGTAQMDAVAALSADPTGVYSYGQTWGAFPEQSYAGGNDVFIRKYSANGDEHWTVQFGTPAHELSGKVCAHETGVYLVGSTTGILAGQANAGGTDVFLCRLGLDGSETWTHQFGTSYSDAGFAISVYGDAVYVAGYTDGTLPGETNSGGRDAFVSRYDLDGNHVWTHQFGTCDADVANDAIATPVGVCVVGYIHGAVPVEPRTGLEEGFVRMYDPDGSVIWTRYFGTSDADGAATVYLGPFGIYVAGFTDGAVPGQTSSGGRDGYVWMFDLDGNDVWAHQLGTTGFEQCYDISGNSTGIYTVGATSGIFPGQTSLGTPDGFIAKFGAPDDPVYLLTQLVKYVAGMNLHQGIENSLDAKLGVALKALQDLKENNDIAAVNALEAFVNEVEAQAGNKIPVEDADILISAAQQIIGLISQGGGSQSAGTPGKAPEGLGLMQNYPNPLRSETAIRFSMPEMRHATLTIYDVAGRPVETLVDRVLPAGVHTASWRANVPAGTYFYRLQAGDFTDIKKMVLLR